jgi:hypothetical protein
MAELPRGEALLEQRCLCATDGVPREEAERAQLLISQRAIAPGFLFSRDQPAFALGYYRGSASSSSSRSAREIMDEMGEFIVGPGSAAVWLRAARAF